MTVLVCLTKADVLYEELYEEFVIDETQAPSDITLKRNIEEDLTVSNLDFTTLLIVKVGMVFSVH